MLRKESSTPKLSWILVIICPPSGKCPAKKVIVSADPSQAKKNRQETARRFSIDGREQTRNGLACSWSEDTIIGIDPEPSFCPLAPLRI
jgi:hypothetical protein